MVMRSMRFKTIAERAQRSEECPGATRVINGMSVPVLISHCEISSCRGLINSTLRPSRTSKFPFSTNRTLPEFAVLPVRFGIVPANVENSANLKPLSIVAGSLTGVYSKMGQFNTIR